MSLQIGDRVRITKSIYKAHPSRMRGGTGTVVEVHTYSGDGLVLYSVEVDNDPDANRLGWAFRREELQRLPNLKA